MSVNQIFGVILVLGCAFTTGHTLECYACNVTVSATHSEPCKGLGSIQKCQDPALCLSATYSFEDDVSKVKQYTIVKSCYPQMAGLECDNFLKAITNMSPASAKIEFSEECFTCEEKGCNERIGAGGSAKIISALLMWFTCYSLFFL